MATLDPATLEKFQKFQAMLAESPEIVAALNSPEILALAALAAEKKNSAQSLSELEPKPQPEYPMVGYGVSDDVSVMSEMTTPTVMTRQSVEEDEFYPEVDGVGTSSSGRGVGLRRIGLKIGVSASEDGSLPPPPPKAKIKSSLKMRSARATTRKNKSMAPMFKIIENEGSVATEESNESVLSGAPSMTPKTLEPHPFLGASGRGTVRGVARHHSSMSRNRRGVNERGVNRNRSMPTNIIKLSSSGSASSDSLHENDDNTKASSGNTTRASSGTNSTSSVSNGKSKLRVGLSPPRPSIRKSKGTGGTAGRGVVRNRSMPMKLKRGSNGSVSSDSLHEDDDNTKSFGEINLSHSDAKEKSVPKVEESVLRIRDRDGRETIKSTGSRNSSIKSVPRMQLVPVVLAKNKSAGSVDSNPTIMVRSDQNKTRIRSRSVSSKSKVPVLDNTDGDNSRSSETEKISEQDSKNSNSTIEDENCQSDDGSDEINSESSEMISVSSDSSSSGSAKDRSSVTRRWKPPSNDESNIPPAFRVVGSYHSHKSEDSIKRGPSNDESVIPPAFRFAGSNHSHKSKNSIKRGSRSSKSTSARVSSNSSKSEEEKESRSEEQNEITSSSDSEEEEAYVRQTVRKPGKVASTGIDKNTTFPNPKLFKQYVSEITQVIQGENSRPSDYLPGSGSPFTCTRKKRVSPKKPLATPSKSGGPRSEEWLGSGKVQKRTWKVKGT